jgi:hypothetical protein
MKKPEILADNQPSPTGVALRRLVRRLKRVSEIMRQVGADLEYYGGFGPMGDRGREMLGAARMAKGWTKHIEKMADALDNKGKRVDKNADNHKTPNAEFRNAASGAPGLDGGVQ